MCSEAGPESDGQGLCRSRRNWKNLPPNQRARPVQYLELIDEVSRKEERRKLESSPTGANLRSLSVISLDIKGGRAGLGAGDRTRSTNNLNKPP